MRRPRGRGWSTRSAASRTRRRNTAKKRTAITAMAAGPIMVPALVVRVLVRGGGPTRVAQKRVTKKGAVLAPGDRVPPGDETAEPEGSGDAAATDPSAGSGTTPPP